MYVFVAIIIFNCVYNNVYIFFILFLVFLALKASIQ